MRIHTAQLLEDIGRRLMDDTCQLLTATEIPASCHLQLQQLCWSLAFHSCRHSLQDLSQSTSTRCSLPKHHHHHHRMTRQLRCFHDHSYYHRQSRLTCHYVGPCHCGCHQLRLFAPELGAVAAHLPDSRRYCKLPHNYVDEAAVSSPYHLMSAAMLTADCKCLEVIA